MPRQPRPDIADIPLHVTQRGNDRRLRFFEESNHVRLPAGTTRADLEGTLRGTRLRIDDQPRPSARQARGYRPRRLMQSIGRRYVRYCPRSPPSHRHPVGRPLQDVPGRSQNLSSAVLPLHRTQPGARTHVGRPRRLSVVKLQGQRQRHA